MEAERRRAETAPRPCGLAHLHAKYGLAVPPPRTTTLLRRGTKPDIHDVAGLTQYLPLAYDPGPRDQDHLEFALKHEEPDLRVLAAWCRQPHAGDVVTAYVSEKPTGEYARRAWFLYEWLTGLTLPLPDGTPRKYVPLLDEKEWVVNARPVRSPRHHVLDNLLGPALLCPMVRRTPEVQALLAFDVQKACEEAVPATDQALLHRAASALWLKETRASFALEAEPLPKDDARTRRFVAQLEEVTRTARVGKPHLLKWQRELVEQRYAAADYRADQVYVAQDLGLGHSTRVHYIAPRPGDVPAFMDAFLSLDETLAGAPPLVHAAAWAFAFVFVHPFDDGNGRLHRLLIHNVAARRGLTPRDFVLPVSAVMLNERRDYDEALETFSRPVMQVIGGGYDVDNLGEMTVHADTLDLYRSFDATPLVEALGRWMQRALKDGLASELGRLRRYDAARAAVQAVVDMPDRKLHLFFSLVEQNRGTLSAAKRGLFAELTDDEVARMEQAVRTHLLEDAPSPAS